VGDCAMKHGPGEVYDAMISASPYAKKEVG
jgi:hypothetical protein